MDKIICPNCGAAIYATEPKCPFCGYINVAGAEGKFMQDMNHTKEALKEIPELQKKNFKKSMSKSSKIVLITIGVVTVLFIVLFGFFWMMENVVYQNEYDPKAEAIWERENYPYLDELYEEGKYDEILEYSWNLYAINEKEGTNHSIHNWEHADYIYVYGRYLDLQNYVDTLDKGEELSKYQAENAVYDGMWFYYREYDKYRTYTEEEIALIEEYREYAKTLLFDRLKFTQEEADELYESILEYGSMDAEKCFKYARKIRKRFE